jgi:hypothetical protein
MGVSSQRHDPGNKPGTHRAEGWVGPMAGLDGIRFRTVQPAASPYADYAILADIWCVLSSYTSLCNSLEAP